MNIKIHSNKRSQTGNEMKQPTTGYNPAAACVFWGWADRRERVIP